VARGVCARLGGALRGPGARRGMRYSKAPTIPVAREHRAPRVSRSEHPAEAGARSPANAVLALQRTAGNAATTSLLAARVPVQRKPEVPGMSKSAETKVKPLLAGSAADKQKAINIVVAQLRANGRVRVPRKKLDGRKVHYDSSVSGEGETSTDYSATGRPKKCKVSMGDAAFDSVAWLYSSIIHELRHAEQRLAVKLSKLSSQAFRETEAYTVEILRSKETGVFSDAAKMEDLWTRLHDEHWVNITDAAEKKRVKKRVKRCHKIAKKATGKTLTFTP
jgi:hypothetical protein